MPITVNHPLTATTPDNTSYEIRPSHWNSAHAITANLSGTEISNAFSNANGISFGTNAQSAITGSYTVPSTAGLLSAVNVSAGNTSNNLSAFTFSNSNGVSFGLSGSTITASAAAGGGGTGISGIADNAHTQTIGTVSFANSNGISFGLSTGANTGTITASYTVPATAGLISGLNVSGGAGNSQSAVSGITFNNSNGLTFGVSTGASVVTVTASYTVPTVTNSSWTVSDAATSGSVARLAFTNLNGITLSLSTGAGGSHTIVGSYTVPTQTVQTLSAIVSSNTTGNTSGMTVDARSISFQGFGIATVGLSTTNTGSSILISATQSNQAFSAGGGSSAFQTLSFTNSNNVSFSNTNGSVWASYALNVSAGGGTSNPLSAITFSNSNGVTFGLSTGAGVGTLTASYNSTTAVGLNTAQTNVTWTVNTSGISFNAGGYAGTTTAITGLASITLNTAGLNFNGSSLLGANTAQTNVTWTVNSSGISLNAGGYAGTGITFGTTTGSSSGTHNTAGLSALVPTLTRFFVPDPHNLAALSAPVNASISFQYMSVPTPITGSRIDLLMGHSGSSTASNVTWGFNLSIYAAIYTVNAASLSSLSSGSTQTTYTWNSNSAGHTEFTQSNIIPISCPVNFNIPPGEYIVGVNFITASTGTNVGNTWSVMGGNQLQSALVYAEVGSASNASVNLLHGMGVYSAASTGLSGVYSLSGIVQTGSSLSQANVALVFRNA